MTAAPAKPKILVVEDQPSVSATMIGLLKRVGCDAVSAQTGTEGIRLAQAEAFDLITLDIDLPDIDGLEVCRRLKQDQRCFQTPVIFVSGRVCEGHRQRCLKLGAADYIVKPFDTFAFVTRIFFHLNNT